MGVSKNGGYHGEAEVDVNNWIWGKIWHCLVGGLKPSEKYESQLGLIFPTEWEKKHVPNHQPEYIGIWNCQR